MEKLPPQLKWTALRHPQNYRKHLPFWQWRTQKGQLAQGELGNSTATFPLELWLCKFIFGVGKISQKHTQNKCG